MNAPVNRRRTSIFTVYLVFSLYYTAHFFFLVAARSNQGANLAL